MLCCRVTACVGERGDGCCFLFLEKLISFWALLSNASGLYKTSEASMRRKLRAGSNVMTSGHRLCVARLHDAGYFAPHRMPLFLFVHAWPSLGIYCSRGAPY